MRPLIEEWSSISPEYFGLYEVSTFGRVRSLDGHYERRDKFGKTHVLERKGKILSPQIRGQYLAVTLYSGLGEKKMCSIHRLVATAFTGNPYDLPQVNHIDEDKHNNNFENLEWCSASYNQSYSKSVGYYLMVKGGKKFVVRNVRGFCKRHPEFNYCGFNRIKNGKQKTINGWEVTYHPFN
jgi:hypothetical protein